ncbi:MAG: Holliday junction resolvase RuvX [Actinomycetaceae bacterium]|nr:Holliday junction resolvase RuvX [Actinomycetaceae bacterium]
MNRRRGPRMGIDYGSVRIGVAVTDPEGRVVFPKTQIKVGKYGEHIDELADIADELNPIEIAIGYPRHLKGAAGRSAKAARKLAHELKQVLPRPRICLVDERMTTNQAHARLAAQGIDNRARQDKIDQLAAAIILETSISFEEQTGELPGETVSRGQS